MDTGHRVYFFSLFKLHAPPFSNRTCEGVPEKEKR